MKKLLTIIPVMLIFSTCSIQEPAKTGDGEAVSFIVFSDVQQGYGIYSALAKNIGRINPIPVAAFCCGDIMLRACNDAEWMSFHRYSDPITDRMPLYIARGNHEKNDSVSESVFAEETGTRGKTFYQTIRQDSLLFIILDTDVRGEENGILGIQLKWLGAMLESVASDNKVRYIFLFMHKPLFPQGPHKATPLTNADDLHVLFLQYPKIRAVFSGHNHLFNRYEKDGLIYITTGGGGGDLYHGYGGDYHHFVKVSLHRGSVRFNLKTIGIFNEVVDDFDL